MTVSPATYNLLIHQRASFSQEFTLPFDCTNKTVEAQVWNGTRTKKLLQFTTVWIDRAEVVPDTDPTEYKGRFKLTASWESTRLVKLTGKWDLLVIDDQTGTREYWLEGDAVLDPGYTEALT